MDETEPFDYELPTEAIAQEPLEPRDRARLLVDGEPVRHLTVADLPSLLGHGDVVVRNRSRVIPARVEGRRPTGGACELLLLEESGDRTWRGLVRPSRKLAPGSVIEVGDALTVTVGADHGDGIRTLTLHTDDVAGALARHGRMPLPPYIDTDPEDPERYQTVYATTPGSAAAPTAGLHLTHDLIGRIRGAGAAVVDVELHVGLDTFRPVTVTRLADHRMHSERYRIEPEVWDRIGSAGRVVAIGTTVVRTLEAAAATGDLAGRTDLFIRAPFEFAIVDALMTNFHLPRSTLLMMIDAFIGPRWRDLYAEALAEGYRFLSFGDAMFLERR